MAVICDITGLWEDVVGGGVQDIIPECPWEDINSVLKDWKKIMKDYKKISVEIFQLFFSSYPSYKGLFPRFSHIPDAELAENKDFLLHCYAALRGIDSVLRTWSGEFEEKNEILPLVGLLHFKRGITMEIIEYFKESLLFVCCDYLKSNREEKASWNVVMSYILENYFGKNNTELNKKTKKEEKKNRDST